MRVRLVPLLVLAALPSCFLFEHRAKANVLLFVVDSLRFDAFSKSIGAADTPNVHALSAEGLTFRSCYAHSSVTFPAHVAIASARAPNVSGVRNDGQVIDSEVPLLAQHLKERDWRTFADVSSGELAPVGREQGLDRGFETFRVHSNPVVDATEVNERVTNFLESADRATPWLAYVHYSDPARADELGEAKEVTAKVFLDGSPIGSVRTNAAEDWSVKIDVGAGTHKLEFRSEDTFNLRRLDITSDTMVFTPYFEQGRLFAPMQKLVVSFTNDRDSVVTCRVQAQIRGVQTLAECRAHYKQQVEAVDRAIGDVIATLKKTGQYDNTVIVVTGSHGESLGEHGVTGHDITLYDEVLRVPLIIKPVLDEDRRVALGKRQFGLVRQIDIAPTILELVGERPLPGAEGLSLLQEGTRELVAESHPPEAPSAILARRDDRYKLVFIAREDRFEMFDVKRDTLEAENIFALQGQFRPTWQTELRRLADAAPQTANHRSKFAPKVPTGEELTGPRSVKN